MQRFGYIRKMSDPYLFEDVLMTALEERKNVNKIIRTQYSRDGGIDGVVHLNNEILFVQAKLYTGPIAKRHVLAFKELLQKKSIRVGKGLFIHTGKTSEPIKKLVWQSQEIEMISGVNKLLALLDGEPLKIFGQSI